MKRILNYIALAIAAAPFVAASCQKEVSAPEKGAQNAALETRTFSVVLAPDTRVTITPETPGTDNTVAKTRWEAGDEILIHGEYVNKTGYSVVVTLTADDISNDGQTASVKVTLGTGTEEGTVKPYTRDDYVSTLYAAYPAASVIQSEKHCYYYNVFTDTNAPLMTGYDDGEGSILLRNNCAVLSFVMPSSEDFDAYVFSGNGEETVGYESFVARYAQSTTESTTELKQDQGISSSGCDTSGPLTSVSGPVVCDGATLNRICIPTRTADDNIVAFPGGFTIKFMKDGVITKMAVVSSSVSLSRSDYMPLGDISSHLKPYVDDHKSSIPTDGAVNLAATESANCYIITAPGIYKLPAVKGNSSESAGDVGGVELVWETYNSAAAVTANSVIKAVDYEDNWVYFETPATLQPGNALIAAKNAAGAIIWSWHIWIPADQIQEVGSYAVSEKYLMDRNLGALRATVAGDVIIDITSVGLFYQWGRKDPFVGPDHIDEGKYLGSGSIAGTPYSAEKIQLTLEESIQRPTVFARGYYDNGTQRNPDWCADQNGEYWGDSGNKSIFDPCPAGYRVPKRDKNKLLWADSVTGYEYSASNYWFKVGDPAVVFPATGWIDGGTLKSTCRFGLWNAHNDSWVNDNPSDAPYGYGSYAAYARRFYLEGGAVKLKNSSVYKSLGYNVRCESVSKLVPEPEEPMTPATGVVLDGGMTEWASATAFPFPSSSSQNMVEWKYGYDADNVYFYYKIKASEIKYNESGDYDWASYIYIGFDTDNDSTTGSRVGGGTDMETGGEAKVLIYPWRGNHTDGTFTFVNDMDGNGRIECPVGSLIDGAHASAFGFIDGDYAYLEVGISRSLIGVPASGKIAVSHCMDYNGARSPRKAININ